MRERVDERVPFAFGIKYDWTGALLVHAADYSDYLGEHFYGYPNLVIDADKQAFLETTDPPEHRVRRMPNKVQFKLEAREEYPKKMPFLKDKKLMFAFDEWAPGNARVNQSTNPAPGNPMLSTLTDSVINPTETAQECDLTLTGLQPVGGAKFWQLMASPGKSKASTEFGPSVFAGPPATMAESSLSQVPGRVTLPPASISVYEIAVK